jgi:ABC-2 type transport system ATP-binding protein
VQEVEPGLYAVAATPSPALLARLTLWLSERDVLLSELQVGRRSLEDVYLSLTGREAVEEGQLPSPQEDGARLPQM